MALNELTHQVKQGQIKSVEIQDDRVRAVTAAGERPRVAQALIERETLQGDELDGLFSD